MKHKVSTFITNNRTLLLLLLLVLVGGFLRFYNLNWDNGQYFHPDERNIANAVGRIRFFSHLDPEFFAYGGFSIYLYRAAAELMAYLTQNTVWLHDWGHINLVGRYVSAFFATLTIPFIFLLGKTVFDKKIGLLAAVFATFIPSFIQMAHFDVTESFLTLCIVVITYVSIQMYKKHSWKWYLLCGICCGVALAAKTSAISFFIPPVIAYILSFQKNRNHFLITTRMLIFSLLTSFLFFFVFSPFTFFNHVKFLESMRYESGVVAGTLLVPYTLQFVDTKPYVFQLYNFFWQIGPLAILSLAAFALLIFQAVVKRNRVFLVFLAFPICYFLYVGSWHTKFIRYMVPFLPFLLITISYLLFFLKAHTKRVGTLLITLFIGITALWGLAFFHIYLAEQTRITASKWVYTNIPANSVILSEHWDEGLPISVDTQNPSSYNTEALTIYEQDNGGKINYYAEKLSNADYIIINSRRLYGTLMKLHTMYPITSKYYRLLFAGDLGYEKIKEFPSYPQLFGFVINDDASEETFQVYDHPKALVFKNTKRLPKDELQKILMR